MNLKSLGTDLLLCVLLLAAATMGARYWAGRIRADEHQKTITSLDAAWKEKLASVEQKGATERKAQGVQYEKRLSVVVAERNRALGELRKRPSRTEQAIPASATCPAVPACTGDRLARDDAEFLARYAAGAALVSSQLKEAREGFATCSKVLEEVTNGQH